MCVGVPMQVLRYEGVNALCESREGEQQLVDMLLVGELPVGSWVMVFLGAAREVLDETTALQVSDALKALSLSMQGEQSLDHLFADLIDREPSLPEFLREQVDKLGTKH